MDLKDIKKKLYQECSAVLAKRIEVAKSSMERAQESANAEGKSSAGDKYETGRAMAQIERDKYAVQLDEALKLKQILDKINPDLTSDTIHTGSVILTTNGNYYLSVSIGKITIDKSDFFALSPSSPLGSLFLNKRSEDKVTFNNREYKILSVG